MRHPPMKDVSSRFRPEAISRRGFFGFVTAACLATGLGACAHGDSASPLQATWTASPQDYNETIPIEGVPSPVPRSF